MVLHTGGENTEMTSLLHPAIGAASRNHLTTESEIHHTY